MASAQAMLEEKEYREITVLDLVADSGVNRNTFYYHFKDMPALVLELAKRGVDRCFAAAKGSAADKLVFLINEMYQKKESILHVYSSMDRAVFDDGLDQVCEHLASKLYALGFESNDLEKANCCLLIKSCCYGLVSDWLAKGLEEESGTKLASICIDFTRSIR